MAKILTCLLGFFMGCCWLPAASQPYVIDKIIAVVGDHIILKSDIEIQYQQYAMQGEVTPELKCGLLDQLITQKMFLQQALIDSIEITEEEVETELNRRINYFADLIGSVEALEQYYGKPVIALKEEFREDIRNQLLAEKMQSKVTSDIRVSPAEVREFFNSIPPDSLPYFNAEVEIGQLIVYVKISEEQKAVARQQLEELRQRILAGEDFETLAILYSDDPGSAKKGGDLGFIKRGETVPEFEAAAFNLKEGEVSEIIETQFGYHIIQLLERKGETVHIRHILIKPEFSEQDILATQTLLDSIRTLIVEGKMTFAEAVNKFSEHKATKINGGMLKNPATGSNFWEIDDLDKTLFLAIKDMQPGDISKPQLFETDDGRFAYRLIYLKSRTKPHKANLKEDYDKIQVAALNYKKQKALKEWFKKKIASTYIRIDEEYLTCQSIKKWLQQ